MNSAAPTLYVELHWSQRVRVAPAISLSDESTSELTRPPRSGRMSVRLTQRASIALLATQGLQNKAMAEQLGVGQVQVERWRERYLQSGLEGIERDLPRGAPPVKVEVKGLVDLTTQSKPAAATHCSTRKLAAELGAYASTVWRHWRSHDLKPHGVRGFKVPREPQIDKKLKDIVGLSMSPPEHALMPCCDEKSQERALDHTQPGLPLKEECAQALTHDYESHSTTILFAALNVLNGMVIGRCQQRHTHAACLKFLRKIDRETPKGKTLHLIAHNHATDKHPASKEWLAKHPRFRTQFTPTSASWLNRVDRYFRDITTDRLRRDVLTSVAELEAAIDEYFAHYEANPKPFIWTKCGRDIVQKVSSGQLAL